MGSITSASLKEKLDASSDAELATLARRISSEGRSRLLAILQGGAPAPPAPVDCIPCLVPFELKNEWVPGLYEMEKGIMDYFADAPEALITEFNIEDQRAAFTSQPGKDVYDQPHLAPLLEQCDRSVLKIDTTPYGGTKKEMIITVNKVKGVEDANRSAHLYFHQGAFVFNGGDHDPSGTGLRVQPEACREALAFDVTCFGVDYGVAPEHRMPGSIMNCYAALKYISEHAAELNINPANITYGGDSAGGGHAAMLSYQLALRDEQHLVKFCYMDVGPVSDHWFDLKEEDKLHEFEYACRIGTIVPMATYCTHDETIEGARETKPDMTEVEYSQYIAAKYAKGNPVIHPALATDDIARRMPPMFITTREFDSYRRDAVIFGELLKRNGRLLMEPYIQPGTSHMSTFMGYDDVEGVPPGRKEFEAAQQKFYTHFADQLFLK